MKKYEVMSYEQFFRAFGEIEGHETIAQLYGWYCKGYEAGNNDKARELINLLNLETK